MVEEDRGLSVRHPPQHPLSSQDEPPLGVDAFTHAPWLRKLLYVCHLGGFVSLVSTMVGKDDPHAGRSALDTPVGLPLLFVILG